MENHPDLSQRLQQLETVAAITELKYRYLNACDEKQAQQVTECFAPGEIDIDFGHIGRFSKREDFVKVFVGLGCHDHIVDMHHAQNPIITLLSETVAEGKIGLRFQSINTRDKTRLQLGGFYSDEYRYRSGQWLITRSHFTVCSVEMIDFSGASSVVAYAGNRMPPS